MNIRHCKKRCLYLFSLNICFFLLLAHTSLAATDCSGRLCPFPAFTDIPTFIKLALTALVQLAIPIVGLFIIIAGFKFLTAQGNTTKLTEARDNFKSVVYGAILILGAWALAVLIWQTVQPLLQSAGIGGGSGFPPLP